MLAGKLQNFLEKFNIKCNENKRWVLFLSHVSESASYTIGKPSYLSQHCKTKSTDAR